MDDNGIQAILFDLDGTLVDTARDLASALNYLLVQEGQKPIALAKIRPYASCGTGALIKAGFNIDESDSRFCHLRQAIIDRYRAHIADESTLFEGIASLLDHLEAEGLPWGVVTNKPGFLTQPLMAQLELLNRAAVVVSGDTLQQRKPDPAPLLYACKQIARDPKTSIYIGDAERDINAGRAAGMYTIAAHYGYIGEDDRPAEWGAESDVTHASQLKPIIEQLMVHR